MAEHQTVELGQLVHDGDGSLGVVAVGHTAVVEVHRDEGVVQVAVPELEQRRRNVGVAALRHDPLVALDLQGVDLVNVTGHPAGRE